MRSVEEIIYIEDTIRDNLTQILTKLNREEKLDEFLRLAGLNVLLPATEQYKPYKSGKIVVIGKSDTKEKDLIGIAKKMGLSKDRFEFHSDYHEIKMTNFNYLQWNPTYSAVLFGPVPHSGKTKESHSSIIAEMEQTKGYPPVVRLGNNTLKITKNSFKEALQDLISNEKIIL